MGGAQCRVVPWIPLQHVCDVGDVTCSSPGGGGKHIKCKAHEFSSRAVTPFFLAPITITNAGESSVVCCKLDPEENKGRMPPKGAEKALGLACPVPGPAGFELS